MSAGWQRRTVKSETVSRGALEMKSSSAETYEPRRLVGLLNRPTKLAAGCVDLVFPAGTIVEIGEATGWMEVHWMRDRVTRVYAYVINTEGGRTRYTQMISTDAVEPI